MCFIWWYASIYCHQGPIIPFPNEFIAEQPDCSLNQITMSRFHSIGILTSVWQAMETGVELSQAAPPPNLPTPHSSRGDLPLLPHPAPPLLEPKT